MLLPLPSCCIRWVSLTLLLACGGCASNAAFTTFEPGQGPGLGSRRISILSVAGPPRLATLAEAELSNRLRAVGFYELIPPPKTPQVATASFRGRDGSVVRWSQNRGVDTVLRAWIESSYEGVSEGGMSFGDPTIRVSMTVELVDAQLDRALARETFSETDRVDTDADPIDAGSEQNVLAALTKKCAQRALDTLFVREKIITTQLATGGYSLRNGASDIRRGNKLASAGDWHGAKLAYQVALKANPQNADAAYNLGVAHEALHNYGAARNLYRMAADQADNEEYRSAEVRVERAIDAQRVAAKVRQNRSQYANIAKSAQRPAGSKWVMPASATLPSRPTAPNNSRVRRIPPVD